MKKLGRYSSIFEQIFAERYKPGMEEIDFDRADIIRWADELKIKVPQNPYDLGYSFRYRAELPSSIQRYAGPERAWIIRGIGPAKYRLILARKVNLSPNPMLAETKIPNSTPGVVAKYTLNDEQAVLARVRYNRLIDVFTGVVCYSLQNHLRTTVSKIQVEIDELYIGVDRRGSHYVIPVQAKGGRDRLNIVQVEQDVEVCASKFPTLICRPVGAQFMAEDVIALFEFEQSEGGISVVQEKHYEIGVSGQCFR
jgi:hypothetical protein